MKQLLAVLIAGVFATAAFADSSAPMTAQKDKTMASTTTTTTKHTTKKHHHVKHHKAKVAHDASMAK